MTNEENNKEVIEAGNVLIAEFMGFVIKNFGAAFLRYTDYAHRNEEYYDWKLVRDLKYHSDWNWLMTVVEKIIYGEYPDLDESKYNHYSLAIMRELSYAKIEAVWKAVVEFIEWYNNHKK